MSFPLLRALQRDRFFQLLIIVGVVLSVFTPFTPRSWPGAIDWHTIITLSGLMLLTKGVELSGYFDVLGRKMTRAAVDVSDQRCGIVYCCPADHHPEKIVRHSGESPDYL